MQAEQWESEFAPVGQVGQVEFMLAAAVDEECRCFSN